MADPPPITAEEFARLCDFLYRRTGMTFTETKRYYVDRRAAERMAATRSSTFASYFARLRGDVGHEVEHFINAFTVNETYFYREEHQLQCLTSEMLPERVRDGRKAIRIWSAPCSTGEEPWSVAIWLLENWPLVDQYEIEIIGSYINTAALQACAQGEFGKRALMRLTEDLVTRYFVALGTERWRLIDALRESVQFTRVNLIDAADVRAQGRFDVIFCRNMLIYFDDASRRVAAENLFESLLPGGFLCLGHTESMSRISPLLDFHC